MGLYYWRHVYFSLLLKYFTNSTAAACEQHWKNVAVWCQNTYTCPYMYLWYWYYVYNPLLLKYFTNSTAAACEQHWRNVAVWCLKYLYMSLYVSMALIRCRYYVYNPLMLKYFTNSTAAACEQHSRNVAVWCLKYIYMSFICVHGIDIMSIIHYCRNIWQTALLQQVNSIHVMLQIDV